MSFLIKMSEATAIALHALAYLASQNTVHSANHLAEVCNASEAHTMKICQRLCKADILGARRGPKGGFFLQQLPNKVRLSQIYELFDGKMQGKPCMFETPACGKKQVFDCIFGGQMAKINNQLIEYFQQTRLSDIAVNCQHALNPGKS